MARALELHIWMQNKKQTWTEPEVVNRLGKHQRGKRIVLELKEGTTVAEMKVAVATELDRWRKQLRYYYVVVVAQRDDGRIGYRTIVPKTIV